MMSHDEITREELHAYLDDLLADSDMARIERTLRDSAPLRERLRAARDERDRGEHSLGAIWRRERLSCISREDLNGYLHGILDEGFRDYIEFHLQTIECPTCLANLADLREKQKENNSPKRRRKIVDSSKKLLKEMSGEG